LSDAARFIIEAHGSHSSLCQGGRPLHKGEDLLFLADECTDLFA